MFAGVRSKYGRDRGEEAAIRMVLALVSVFVTGLLHCSWGVGCGMGRVDTDLYWGCGEGRDQGRGISAWFMKATGR